MEKQKLKRKQVMPQLLISEHSIEVSFTHKCALKQLLNRERQQKV